MVYLISDGEETCGGDPVGAATALANMGIQASVNTIGFAVDAETEAQLQAIAAAGGGQYYPAETANALQAQLRAIQEAEASLARYDYCVALNAAAISGAHQAVVTEMVQCYGRNDPTDRQLAIIQAMRRAEREERPEAACADELNRAARSIARENRGWMQQNVSPLQDEIGPAVEAYRDSARLARRE